MQICNLGAEFAFDSVTPKLFNSTCVINETLIPNLFFYDDNDSFKVLSR